MLNFNPGKTHNENRIHNLAAFSVAGPACWLFLQGLPVSSEENDKPDRHLHRPYDFTPHSHPLWTELLKPMWESLTITLWDF